MNIWITKLRKSEDFEGIYLINIIKVNDYFFSNSYY